MRLNWRKNVVTKKAVRYGMSIPRLAANLLCPKEACSRHPPVLANSFPKSGTYLLIQILQVLPGIRDWGLFLASTPSFSFREISAVRTSQKIQKLAPGELVGGHLFYSEKAAKALKTKPVVHFFIYRDPRDVVISEAHYLSEMNHWHRLSKYFRQLPNMDQQINFSITGATELDFPYDYPNIAQRFARYHEWINDPNTLSLQYEDLILENREQVIRKIVRYYFDRTHSEFDQNTYITKALSNLNPSNSHTYRQGKAGGWREVFTERHKSIFKELAGHLLIELGYEQDKNW